MRIHLIHGLEGSPTGEKSKLLSKHFDLLCPAMDTGDFDACVELHAKAIKARPPDVLVGSSFGGAVVCALIARGDWSGPTVLLASAWKSRAPGCLGDVPTLLIHGTHDDVIPVGDSYELAKTGTDVTFVEVDDGHRLRTIVASGALADMVRGMSR